jgi:protein-L-isoaspartate(D-aspartate) O-methyltransferase
MDYAQARQAMVDRQIRPHDVTDLRILGALLDVPRERFFSAEQGSLAYLDAELPVGGSRRRMLKPMVFAKLLQAAGIAESERVLDVGCATGYSSAVLSKLAGNVVALEEDAALARAATANFSEIAARNVTMASGPLTVGWPQGAPYDAILLEGACDIVPDALIAQLKDGGRLFAVTGSGPMGKAMAYRKAGKHVTPLALFDAAAPLLPGFAKPAEFVF